MTIRVGNRRFAPSLLGTIVAALAIVLFARLGVWQLDRADQKRTIQAQQSAGQEHTVELASQSASGLDRYQRVRVRGRYDPQHQILLDNMPSQGGRPGYRVLTPLRLANGSWLMVDRGWLPLGRTREELPDVTIGDHARVITGQLDDLPQPGMRLNEQVVATNGARWPQVMNFPRHEDVERVLQHTVQQRIVRLDPAEPDGYERTWTLAPRFGPERHVGYAAQWFALAGATLIAFLILSSRVERSTT